jgi:hypothetical protein
MKLVNSEIARFTRSILFNPPSNPDMSRPENALEILTMGSQSFIASWGDRFSLKASENLSGTGLFKIISREAAIEVYPIY